LKKNHIGSLTGIRFFLAIWVLLFHTCDVWKDYPFLYNLFSKGYVAVSAFFVLSGFILVYNYANLQTDSKSLKMFSIARVIRLYPMYLLSIIIAFPLFAYFQFKTEPDYLSVIFITTITTLLGVQAWYKPVLEKLNPPSWSLSVEFFFYSLFPFMNKQLSRFSKKGIYILIGFCFIVTFFCMKYLGQTIQNTTHISSIVQTGTFPLLHIFTFLTGMGFGYLYYVHEVSFFKKYTDLATLGIALFLILSLVYNWFPFADINNGGFAIFFSLLFISISNQHSFFAKILSNRFIVLLGESSYSLYILHLVIYAYLKLFFTRLTSFSNFESFGFLLLYLVVSVLIAVFRFLKIEKKLTIYLKERYMKRPALAVRKPVLVSNGYSV
jgi:peptidoglycan/LPS O-acetylase OafA/YrhL